MADGGLSELFAGRAALLHFFERQRSEPFESFHRCPP
jgi:hypothetical protein